MFIEDTEHLTYVHWVHHWCLAPIDLANLCRAVNRSKIIMGEFGCTQIRNLNSCSSKRKKYFGNLIFGSGIFFPEVWSAFWWKWPATIFCRFLATKVKYLSKFWGYTGELGWVFCSNIRLVLLIDPWTWRMFPLTKTEPHSGENRAKLAKIRYTSNANLRARTC